MPLATTTTGNDIVEIAYSKLFDVSPEKIATEEVELRLLLQRSLSALFAFAARVNPLFFGAEATVAFEATLGWLRPKSAESVFRLEYDGDEVSVVPLGQAHMEPGEPTLYELGQYYKSTGETLSPTSGNLKIFYSRKPAVIANLAATLDPAWPEEYNELLALELAVHLALKSDLTGQLAELKANRNEWAGRFAAFLQHETANTRRAWDSRFRVHEALIVLAQ